MDGPPLASLSLTHVNYNPDDVLSLVSAYLALVPQALVITYVSLIWGTREIEILLMFVGQMGCEALNWLLKRYIKEERPTRRWKVQGTHMLSFKPRRTAKSKEFKFPAWKLIRIRAYPIEMLGKGYGMPSSHAQFVAFFSVFLTLFLLVRHDPHNHPYASSTHAPTPYWQRLGLAMLSLMSAAAVAQSRIYLDYHTPRQVHVGVIMGVICALGWFIVTSIARRLGLVDQMLALPPVKWMRFRDLVVNESLEDAGWGRWELAKERRAELMRQKRK